MTNLTTRGWTDSGGRSWHKSAKMPFFNQFSSVLFPGLMSGNWVPKNVIERVGVLLVGVSLSIAGFAFLAASLAVRAEIDATIRMKTIALFVSICMVSLMLLIGGSVVVIGFRLASSSLKAKRD